jgi:hypothetical protein
MKIPEPLKAPIQGFAVGLLCISAFFIEYPLLNLIAAIILLGVLYVTVKED